MFFLSISYLKTLQYLLLRSIKISSKGLFDKIINSLIWSIFTILIYTYIMPNMGMDQTIGTFMAATLPLSCAFFASFNTSYILLIDMTNDGSALTYELLLPIPQWIIFAKYAIENSYQAIVVSFFILPISKLLLWDHLSLEHFSIIKFHFMLIIASISFGFFSIFVASITKDMFSGYDNISNRIIFPMWLLGGYQFSWKTLYQISPTLAYLNLLNPLTYALEGGRSTIIDPQLCLPYWYCIFALIIFAIISGYFGIQKLKKRLDCL
ncbi:hypothetical protein HYV11_00010 [Candidatus Dependentiae bacterium]|nr:hypothetical protein [Candidatus Dependentiae bacterium]